MRSATREFWREEDPHLAPEASRLRALSNAAWAAGTMAYWSAGAKSLENIILATDSYKARAIAHGKNFTGNEKIARARMQATSAAVSRCAG